MHTERGLHQIKLFHSMAAFAPHTKSTIPIQHSCFFCISQMKTTLPLTPTCRPRNNSNKNPVGEIKAKKMKSKEEGKGKKAQEKLLDNYLKFHRFSELRAAASTASRWWRESFVRFSSPLHMPRGPRNGKRKYLMTQKLLKFNLKTFLLVLTLL